MAHRADDWAPRDALALAHADIAHFEARLQSAEKAVTRARTAEAATAAHRHADDLLLQLEAAENKLRLLVEKSQPVADKHVPRFRRGTRAPVQQLGLFDVG